MRSACKKFVPCGKMNRSSEDRIRLPTMTPGMLPIPPSTSIARMNTLTLNPNWSGDTSCSFDASAQPANPLNDAPIANAASLVVVVLMPMCAAASSSSRIAIHARPSRLLRMLFASQTASAISASTMK